uniref:ras-related protein Rab-39B-like n=1 Tax=Styela clava TaxID=7725 RepID=UPI00193AA2DD|nr:ras-related protein Rab-39B-like [Styela clava]
MRAAQRLSLGCCGPTFSMADVQQQPNGSPSRGETIWSYQFRIVLIGDSTVGKSALLRRFSDGDFLEISDPTVGVDFYARLIEIAPSIRIKLQLWDTAGQERFRSITRSYYRNSVGGVLVYDVSSSASFSHIERWMEEASAHVAPRSILFILIGQKSDLEEERKVTQEQGALFARKHKMPFIETSAKTGYNVEEAFHVLTECIYRQLQSGVITAEDGWEGVKCSLLPSPVYSQSEDIDSSTKKKCC